MESIKDVKDAPRPPSSLSIINLGKISEGTTVKDLKIILFE
jgi:hypothetical protein